ncbi:MAG: MATE family efflux transporter, partial [Spirochaetaceae bacterium]|nr:MATE family efflux transporter [Spirochaetaceae bacterium]
MWPLIIEQILAVTMGAADTVMVSAVGEFAVSGVSLVDSINNLLIMGFTALATGGAIVVSQYIGRLEMKNASLAARQLMYASTGVALVLMLPILCMHKPILVLLFGSLSGDVMEASSVYFLLTALSYPFLTIQNSAAAIYRAMANSRV